MAVAACWGVGRYWSASAAYGLAAAGNWYDGRCCSVAWLKSCGGLLDAARGVGSRPGAVSEGVTAGAVLLYAAGAVEATPLGNAAYRLVGGCELEAAVAVCCQLAWLSGGGDGGCGCHGCAGGWSSTAGSCGWALVPVANMLAGACCVVLPHAWSACAAVAAHHGAPAAVPWVSAAGSVAGRPWYSVGAGCRSSSLAAAPAPAPASAPDVASAGQDVGAGTSACAVGACAVAVGVVVGAVVVVVAAMSPPPMLTSTAVRLVGVSGERPWSDAAVVVGGAVL